MNCSVQKWSYLYMREFVRRTKLVSSAWCLLGQLMKQLLHRLGYKSDEIGKPSVFVVLVLPMILQWDQLSSWQLWKAKALWWCLLLAFATTAPVQISYASPEGCLAKPSDEHLLPEHQASSSVPQEGAFLAILRVGILYSFQEIGKFPESNIGICISSDGSSLV